MAIRFDLLVGLILLTALAVAGITSLNGCPEGKVCGRCYTVFYGRWCEPCRKDYLGFQGIGE